MATRHCQPTDRARLQLPGSVPVAGFVVALAAALLQAGWWFSHGWTWSNLPRFLMSGQPVTWCVVLILLGASLSWLGLRRADYRGAGREPALAGLAISALAAAPIMLGLLLIGTLASSRPPSRTGLTDTDNGPSHEEHWPDNVTGATLR